MVFVTLLELNLRHFSLDILIRKAEVYTGCVDIAMPQLLLNGIQVSTARHSVATLTKGGKVSPIYWTSTRSLILGSKVIHCRGVHALACGVACKYDGGGSRPLLGLCHAEEGKPTC